MIDQVDVASKWIMAFVCSVGLSLILFASCRCKSLIIFLASIYPTMNFVAWIIVSEHWNNNNHQNKCIISVSFFSCRRKKIASELCKIAEYLLTVAKIIYNHTWIFLLLWIQKALMPCFILIIRQTTKL